MFKRIAAMVLVFMTVGTVSAQQGPFEYVLTAHFGAVRASSDIDVAGHKVTKRGVEFVMPPVPNQITLSADPEGAYWYDSSEGVAQARSSMLADVSADVRPNLVGVIGSYKAIHDVAAEDFDTGFDTDSVSATSVCELARFNGLTGIPPLGLGGLAFFIVQSTTDVNAIFSASITVPQGEEVDFIDSHIRVAINEIDQLGGVVNEIWVFNHDIVGASYVGEGAIVKNETIKGLRLRPGYLYVVEATVKHHSSDSVTAPTGEEVSDSFDIDGSFNIKVEEYNPPI